MELIRNIIQKIWDRHTVELRPDYPDLIFIDLHLLHEVTSPQAFDVLRERGLSVHRKESCIATVDHVVETDPEAREPLDPKAVEMVETLRENCAHHDIRLLDIGSGSQGIVHVIGPELGLSQPGMTIVCGDSHTSTHGAIGALAFGIGSGEVANVLATSCLLRHKPKAMLVKFTGTPSKGAEAKDVVLQMIRQIGVDGGTGHVIEYAGDYISEIDIEGRMTICNMTIECGARAGLVAPDEKTFEYLKSRPVVPSGPRLWRALKSWRLLNSDEGAEYERTVTVDIEGLAPTVTWGTNPSQAVAIDEAVPDPSSLPPEEAKQARKALEYTRLSPGKKLEGTPVDYVFIGSCTNGRITDLRAAAEVFHGRKVAPGVEVYIVPGSVRVYRQAMYEGLAETFARSGVTLRAPGCSMCLAMNSDVVPRGKRCASTSNRNFVGRQGDGAITHLMSPAMAAAAAVTGRITDVRKLLG